jgi:CheY-like chemotaxis protein
MQPIETTSAAPGVLIVDDHEPTARSLAALLKAAGYRTDMALNGAAAMAKASASRPVCAVIDVHLPDVNGLVLSSKLREKLGPDVPLLVFSGDTSMETLGSLPHVGATHFLSKPISAENLLDVIRQYVPAPGKH